MSIVIESKRGTGERMKTSSQRVFLTAHEHGTDRNNSIHLSYDIQ